jgi:hypothetical protein
MALCAVAVSLLFVTAPASAAGEHIWDVKPGGGGLPGARSSFVYTLKPGQIFQDTVSISNASDEPITFDVYATDAFNTPLDAGFALLQEDETPKDSGAWITLATDRLTVQPHTRADVPFQIAIPIGARPGDHAAGIVAADTEVAGATDAPVGVRLRRRVAARVYTRVAGPLTPSLTVRRIEFSHRSALLPPFTGRGDASITYELKNTGNVRLQPTATVTVTGLFGRRILALPPRAFRELLPGSSVVFTESFEGLPAIDHLTAGVRVRARNLPGPDVTASGSRGIWAVSWLAVALLVLLVADVIVLRRLRRSGPPPVEPPRPAKELVSV